MMNGWGGGFGGSGFGAAGYGSNRRFEEQYHCYSVAFADKAHLEVSAFVCVNVGTNIDQFVTGTCEPMELPT
jgi:hypothetical protein